MLFRSPWAGLSRAFGPPGILNGELVSLHASVHEADAQICKTLRDEPWDMRGFGLVTVDGHRIMFGALISIPTNLA